MQPSRRRLLTAVGSVALGLAGRVANEVGDGDSSGDERGVPRPTVDDGTRSTGGTDDRSTGDDGADGTEVASDPNGSTETPSFPTERPLLAQFLGRDREYRRFDRSDIVDVRVVSVSDNPFSVGVTIAEERAAVFLEAVQDAHLVENHENFDVLLTADGETVRQSGITRGLARDRARRDWEGRFLVQ